MAYSGMCLFRNWMIQSHEKVARKILKIEGFQVETIRHRFTITIPVFILSIFWQLLLKNGEISSKFRVCTQHVTITKFLHKQFKQLFSIVHFQIGVIFRFNCYQYPNQLIGNNK